MPELERFLGGAVGQRLIGVTPRTLDELLEAHRVHRVLRDPELIAPSVGDDARPAVVGAKCLAQPRDVELDVLGGARRRAAGPQAIDQLLGAHRPVRAQRKHGKHSPLLASSEW